MAELKNMTVQALRDLARKALGRGHSRLKTKGELVAALQAAEKKVSGAAEKAAAKLKEATGRAEKAAAKLKEATGRAAKAAEKMVRTAKGPAKKTAGAAGAPAPAEPAAKKAAPERTRRAAKPKSASPAKSRKPAAAGVGAADAELEVEAELDRAAADPDPEGHFVARVRGESAVRDAPHPMGESAAAAHAAPAAPRKGFRPDHHHEEHLGDLPWSYGDDAFVALARDPKTLFLYWDHADETLRGAWQGLEGGRPQLWIYVRRVEGDWERIRTVEFALESRSYYVHDLDPGRIYRAEIHVVDRQGGEKLLGRASNEMELPPVGASPVVDDRFMRLPWGEPLQRLLRHVREGGPFPDELRAQFARLSDWGRFGAGGAGGGGSAGGIGGRGGAVPSSPSSPAGPFGSGGRGEGR